MKIFGGAEWTRGDAIAIVGLIFAIVGTVAAVLAIPGMPKIVHYDSDTAGDASKRILPVPSPAAAPTVPALKPVPEERDVTSGQVNFGCEQNLPVETPLVSFGLNARNIQAQASWKNTDNAKSQNQAVVNVNDAAGSHVIGVKASGAITGLDSQNILGVKNCPGGGHGELTLHVSWTEDETAESH